MPIEESKEELRATTASSIPHGIPALIIDEKEALGRELEKEML